MPYQKYAVIRHKAGLRSKVLSEHIEELSYLKPKIDDWSRIRAD